MPAETPSTPDARVLAALDIGTNSLLALWATSAPETGLVPGAELLRSTRLGQQVAAAGRLAEDAMQRTLTAVDEAVVWLQSQNPRGQAVAVATSAVRRAANGDPFLRRCAARLGAPPLLLSGQQEARAIFRGATSDVTPNRLVVCLDIGGGSTELAVGTAGRCAEALSIDIGCINVTERFGMEQAVPERTVRKARTWVLEQIADACDTMAAHVPDGQQALLIASGGTATSLAAWHLELDHYDAAAVHGLHVDGSTVERAVEALCGMDADQRLQWPCVTPGRAPVFAAGAVILAAVMQSLAMPRIHITVRGLRYGMIDMLAAGDVAPTWTW